MPFLSVNNVQVSYLLRRSRRAKRLQIVVKDGYFEVVAPARIKNTLIIHFLWENAKWMLRKLAEKNKQAISQPLIWAASEDIPYRGEQLRLNIKIGQQGVEQRSDSLWLGLSAHVKLDNIENEIKKKTIHWYQIQAKTLIHQVIAQLCPRVGRWPTSITIKRQKTRWGSCGADNKIYINWLLVLAPPGVLEYVVTHEVCHFFHKNHSKRFWQKVESCLPTYKEHEKWLKKHGGSLMSNLI
jgi:predicted metal-dependent hydrolase